MGSVSIAEWMLRRVTTRDRAASIMGDLVEAKSQQGPIQFWLSIAGVLFSTAWSWPLAYLAAFYGANWTFSGLQMSAFGMPFDSPHRASLTWQPALNVLLGIGTILSMTGIYTTIRYGLRDRMAQVALASAGIASLIVCYWWQPYVLIVCIGLSLAGIFISLRNLELRRAVLPTLVTLVAGFASVFLMMYLESLYQNWIIPGPAGDREMRAHPSVGWVGFLLWGLFVFATTKTCSLMHKRSTRNQPADQADAPASVA
jgi:hypothetical protein